MKTFYSVLGALAVVFLLVAILVPSPMAGAALQIVIGAALIMLVYQAIRHFSSKDTLR